MASRFDATGVFLYPVELNKQNRLLEETGNEHPAQPPSFYTP